MILESIYQTLEDEGVIKSLRYKFYNIVPVRAYNNELDETYFEFSNDRVMYRVSLYNSKIYFNGQTYPIDSPTFPEDFIIALRQVSATTLINLSQR